MFGWFKKVERKIPTAGETWQIKDESPWLARDVNVKILDCKNGWVRYDMGGIFRDERMKLNTFLYIYAPVED